jgi:hypothetical protein
MKDRIPTYAGRIKLVPVQGKENVYDVERADEPQQEGTPLNRMTLLNPEIQNLLNLTDDATPSDALSALRDLANTKTQINTGKYIGTDTYGRENPNSITLDFPAKLVIIGSKISGNGAQAILFPEVGFGFSMLSLVDFFAKPLAVSRDGKMISWYSNDSGIAQMNGAYEYQYTALG